MARIFEQTSAQLVALAERHSAALVAFSTGKDSLVVLDLASRSFEQVVPFFMELIPDLPLIESRIAAAEERWGVECVRVPHWSLPNDRGHGVYCVPDKDLLAVGKFGAKDAYALVREETGIGLVLTGDKRSDFFARRMGLAANKDTLLAFPIADWTNLEVADYLAAQQIEAPDSPGDHSGIGLSTAPLLWLHDHHPADFAILCESFPFVPAVVKRRGWYGVEA